MKGWQIFQHSFRQVTGNLPEALQVSLLPFAISLLITFGSRGQMAAFEADPAAMDAGASLALIAGTIVMVVVSVWVAVAWHRFVLLNERPRGFLPNFYGDRAMAYFLRSLGYGLLLVVVLLFTSMVLGLVFMGNPPESRSLPVQLLIGFLFQIPLLTVAFRLMAALPATALGNQTPFLAGWQATSGAAGDIITLAVICALATTLVSQIGGLLLGDLWILLLAFDTVFNWFVTMVGASILTTLYGHYIQGRPLR